MFVSTYMFMKYLNYNGWWGIAPQSTCFITKTFYNYRKYSQLFMSDLEKTVQCKQYNTAFLTVVFI